MNSVFDRFSSLWPLETHASLKPMLSGVDCLLYPDEADRIRGLKHPSKVVLVFRSGELSELMGLVAKGFSHCVHPTRADFAQELLVAALMISRPQAFAKNPMTFFFSGFQNANPLATTQANLTATLQRNTDKPKVLAELSTFLAQNPRLQGLEDLCTQAADELIMNAFFCAPLKANGERMNQSLLRSMPLQLPPGKEATFFATFSDQRVVIGCQDPYGSLEDLPFREHLKASFVPEGARPRQTSAGAGLGMKSMIENSANFYVYVDPGKMSLVACGFLLAGVKANLTSHKQLHFSLSAK